MFRYADPIPPKSFEETPFTWVADTAAFSAMLDKLRSAQEIAIDLEYHSYRSFYGFVCLMQISTREEDFVVDTLAVREELEELNEVFTNPSVVKVDVERLWPFLDETLTRGSGPAWRRERHYLATARLQPLHRQSLRHLPRLKSA